MSGCKFSDEKLTNLAKLIQIINGKFRYKIIKLLILREMTGAEIAEMFTGRSERLQKEVDRDIKLLLDAGLVAISGQIIRKVYNRRFERHQLKRINYYRCTSVHVHRLLESIDAWNEERRLIEDDERNREKPRTGLMSK